MTYDERDVTARITTLLDDAGVDVTVAGTVDNLDQFHIGGAAAVDRLVPGLEVGRGDTVLDVGSGLGGPARQIARRTGARVVGIDITSEYVDAANHLSRQAGLHEAVRFVRTDLADFRPDGELQAAVTMHVQMNVEDKAGWYRLIAGTLPPGGRLAIWEVCRTRPAEPAWPMPWSIDGTDSFLATGDALRSAVETAGFVTRDWVDETAWVGGWLAQTGQALRPAGPALPALLADGPTRVGHFVAALLDGSLGVWRGLFVKAAGG